jgi:hypothetical protein
MQRRNPFENNNNINNLKFFRRGHQKIKFLRGERVTPRFRVWDKNLKIWKGRHKFLYIIRLFILNSIYIYRKNKHIWY